MLTFLLTLACIEPTGKDTPTEGDTGPEPDRCPSSLRSVCEYEFGTDCPTYQEMAAMTCVDYHFDPTASSGEAPRTGDGNEDCPLHTVSCKGVDDANLRTRFYFNAAGIAHPIAVDVIWPSTDACPMDAVIGETLPC